MTANVTTYQNTGLSCSTTYYYRVRAYNTGGNSNYSNIASTTTFVCPPSAPSGLYATSVSGSQINLSWADNSTNEDGFKIERSPTGIDNWAQIGAVGINITFYQNTGLICGMTYYYRVRAYNTGGNSSYSSVATAIVIPCAPVLTRLTIPVMKAFSVSWQPLRGHPVIRYRGYR